MIGSKDIIFVLGAGASAEATIPISAQMIDKVQQLLAANKHWIEYDQLYKHVKSAIYFSAGLRGKFDKEVPFNIETLVNTLLELEKNEEHPLYPFIAAWSSRFVGLAGKDFCEVQQFRAKILKQLKQWMCPEDSTKSAYYKGFVSLQKALTHPLRIFSLNYDLCVERLNEPEFVVETGFPGYGPGNFWDWERFEDSNNVVPNIYLYKLHGSVNWKRTPDTKRLFCVEQTENVDPESMEVIFGRDFKLEAGDPYLFYLYKFRDSTFGAKLIVTLGYGFGDSHINKMLTQSLNAQPDRRLLVIRKCDSSEVATKESEIERLLELNKSGMSQVTVRPGTVKDFLETAELPGVLASLIPPTKDVPF